MLGMYFPRDSLFKKYIPPSHLHNRQVELHGWLFKFILQSKCSSNGEAKFLFVRIPLQGDTLNNRFPA
jgi:hypothetical protein